MMSLGGRSVVEPPVPIPNTEVKRHSADDTALARVWENRSLPGGLYQLGRSFLDRPFSLPLAFPAKTDTETVLKRDGGKLESAVSRRRTHGFIRVATQAAGGYSPLAIA